MCYLKTKERDIKLGAGQEFRVDLGGVGEEWGVSMIKIYYMDFSIKYYIKTHVDKITHSEYSTSVWLIWELEHVVLKYCLRK